MGDEKDFAISRREFARRAALVSAAASLAPINMLSAELPVAPAPQAQTPPSLPKLSPESQSEAESRAQAIFSEYSERFSEAQKTDLQRLCRESQRVLDRLRAYPIENGDGSALYLRPLMEREKKPSPISSATKPAPASKKP